MVTPSKRALVRALMERYGQTYAEEIGIDVNSNRPAPLFQMLCAALLYSARIAAGNATRAARALIDAGLTTPEKMAATTWQERVDVITWHGYKRYDERTATMLGHTARMVLDRYGGDLRRLRVEADFDVAGEHRLLQQFKGIGKVGADIFLREVQGAWDEVYPYADDRVLRAAARLGLGDDVRALSRLVAREEFARLAAALIRVDLGRRYDEIASSAGGQGDTRAPGPG